MAHCQDDQVGALRRDVDGVLMLEVATSLWEGLFVRFILIAAVIAAIVTAVHERRSN